MSNMISIPTTVVTDERLSAKARGLYAWLMVAIKNGKEVTQQTISESGPDGLDAVRSGITELEKLGYLTRTRVRDERGALGPAVYTLHSEPK